MEFRQIIQLLKTGKVGVMPTDTIYGIVGSALDPQTVEEIYRLRKRTPDKPMIILISHFSDLKKFNIKLTKNQNDFLRKIWPNPVSVVLPCQSEKFIYLHRGVNNLAFRIPKNEILLKILKKVGPLVAPSANFETELPAENIDQAKKYFGNKVSFYLDGGKVKSDPSTILKLNSDKTLTILRQGAYQFKQV